MGQGRSKKIARIEAAATALRSFIQFKDGAVLTPLKPACNLDFTSDEHLDNGTTTTSTTNTTTTTMPITTTNSPNITTASTTACCNVILRQPSYHQTPSPPSNATSQHALDVESLTKSELVEIVDNWLKHSKRAAKIANQIASKNAIFINSNNNNNNNNNNVNNNTKDLLFEKIVLSMKSSKYLFCFLFVFVCFSF